MDQTTTGPANVKMSGGLFGKATHVKAAKIVRLGSSPNAIIKIYEPIEQDHGGVTFREVDRLTNASYAADDRKGNHWTVRGVSDTYLSDFAGATPEDDDAIVTWDVTVLGCDGCG